jgi:ADP-ribose pyrophosphatase YjhB (NUDIX family)
VTTPRILHIAQRVAAIAQQGFTFHTNVFDLERDEELRHLAASLLEEVSDDPHEKIVRALAADTGYPTPKVDVRVVLLRGRDEMLLTRERIDNDRWTLPGGWADIGYSPFEVAVKEAREETGLVVRPIRLLALLDKRKHDHPREVWYAYKAFIHCEAIGGELLEGTTETSGSRWFRSDEFAGLDLSMPRVTAPQLDTVLRLAADPSLPAVCD